MSRILIIGAGGHATSAFSVAKCCGYEEVAFVDEERKGGSLLGYPILAIADTDSSEFSEADIFVAVGTNFVRERVSNQLLARRHKGRLVSLIHPQASIGDRCVIDIGTVVMPNATIGPNTRIGRFCIVNTNASIDHDSVMHDYSSIAPGVHTGGRVRIGIRSAVSIGAALKHGVAIGDDSVIGGCSFVTEDIPSGVVAYGIPAKVIRNRQVDEPYL